MAKMEKPTQLTEMAVCGNCKHGETDGDFHVNRCLLFNWGVKPSEFCPCWEKTEPLEQFYRDGYRC